MKPVPSSASIALNRRHFMAGLAAAGPFAVVSPVGAETGKQGPSDSGASVSSHSSLRLLAAPAVPGKPGVYHAVVAIRLNPGFKTYWRHPGDSGVPPVFDFSASQNLASAVVSYAAPVAFADGAGGHSFGYAGPEVFFPLVVTAADSARPVHLALKADYAVCESICILASAAVRLTLASGLDSKHAKVVAAAMAHVPVPVALDRGDSLKIRAIRKSPVPEQFIADVQVPEGVTPALFVEGETPWFFETKAFTRTSATTGEILVAVIERSKAADCTGAEIILTLVADKLAIEVSTRLDLALVTH